MLIFALFANSPWGVHACINIPLHSLNVNSSNGCTFPVILCIAKALIIASSVYSYFVIFLRHKLGKCSVTEPNHISSVFYNFFYAHVGTDCPEPSAPRNGKVVGSQSTIGSTIRYECNLGYTFAPNTVSYAECQPNKLWSNSAPTCQGMLLTLRTIKCHLNLLIY